MLRRGLLSLAAGSLLGCDSNPDRLVGQNTFELGGRRYERTLTERTQTYPGQDEITPGLNRGPQVHSARITLIADPATPAERLFNDRVRALLPELKREVSWAAPYDARVAIEVVGAAPGVILARETLWHYPKGAAWSAEWSRALSWSLKGGRRLSAADFFEPGSGWERALARPLLREMYGEPVEPFDRFQRLDAQQYPRIGRRGMCLKFHEGDSGNQPANQATLIPWETLRPYLRAALPLDPRRIEGSDPWLECPQ